MKTEISTWTVVKRKIQVMWSLESKVKIDNKRMVSLFEDIGFNDGIFQLFL